MTGITREERLADPEMNGGPITVGGLTFTRGTDCFHEPRWYAGGPHGYVVGKFREGQWWYRRTYDSEGLNGVTTTSREEAMAGCAQSHTVVDRLARWKQYMREHEPPLE